MRYPTDQPTDQPTDRPTDTAYYRDARTHLKTNSFVVPLANVRSWIGRHAKSICFSFPCLFSKNLAIRFVPIVPWGSFATFFGHDSGKLCGFFWPWLPLFLGRLRPFLDHLVDESRYSGRLRLFGCHRCLQPIAIGWFDCAVESLDPADRRIHLRKWKSHDDQQTDDPDERVRCSANTFR